MVLSILLYMFSMLRYGLLVSIALNASLSLANCLAASAAFNAASSSAFFALLL